jgi:hypothetical protein
VRERQVAMRRNSYPDLGEALGLPVAKEQALMDLLTDQSNRRARVGDAESDEVGKRRQADEHAQINALIGTGGAQRFQPIRTRFRAGAWSTPGTSHWGRPIR